MISEYLPKTGRIRITRGDGSSFEYVPSSLKLHKIWPLCSWENLTGFGYMREYIRKDSNINAKEPA